ncbi:MAG: hypothetical protein ACJAQ5_000477 [Flavobacteriales bacterium]|jgi:hypothetical protein
MCIDKKIAQLLHQAICPKSNELISPYVASLSKMQSYNSIYSLLFKPLFSSEIYFFSLILSLEIS